MYLPTFTVTNSNNQQFLNKSFFFLSPLPGEYRRVRHNAMQWVPPYYWVMQSIMYR